MKIEYIPHCKGRINRSSYAINMLVLFVAFFSISIITLTISALFKIDDIIIYIMLCMASAIYQISLNVRRLHDLNMSGFWLILIIIIPFIGWLILYLAKGNAKANKYGEPPE